MVGLVLIIMFLTLLMIVGLPLMALDALFKKLGIFLAPFAPCLKSLLVMWWIGCSACIAFETYEEIKKGNEDLVIGILGTIGAMIFLGLLFLGPLF